jgi:hypothetical protein
VRDVAALPVVSQWLLELLLAAVILAVCRLLASSVYPAFMLWLCSAPAACFASVAPDVPGLLWSNRLPCSSDPRLLLCFSLFVCLQPRGPAHDAPDALLHADPDGGRRQR